ncbi:Uncharacterised protein [Vibrio cholerae]|nr:Uncharacterised protein [Vibrio cholerae]CSI55094.1 Uncharacterised protein [Vibrio cholerae]
MLMIINIINNLEIVRILLPRVTALSARQR